MRLIKLNDYAQSCIRLLPIFIFIFPLLSSASEKDFYGEWDLKMERSTPIQGGVIQKKGRIIIEPSDTGPVAFIDGSLIVSKIDGEKILFQLDYYDGGDAPRFDDFQGIYENGRIHGTYIPETTGVPGEKGPPTPWVAEKTIHRDTSKLEPRPQDLTGYWRVKSRGIKKAHKSLTEAGHTAYEVYEDIDDPINRCVSPGLRRTITGRSASEIYIHNQMMKIDYPTAVGKAQRYVHLDGREYPEKIPVSPMGYSIGHWEGTTLEIETRGLQKNFINSNGSPQSTNARIIERFIPSDDLKSMDIEITLIDPENYLRHITYFSTLARSSEPQMSGNDCDPHAFYRVMDINGQLPEYFSRSGYRP
jgi:hypothetical protein